jgi:hypothetical protein
MSVNRQTLNEPDEMVSDAFLKFAYRRAELSDFTTFYHTLAKRAISPENENADDKLYKEYRGQGIFFLENYIIRISDFFDIYLEHLIYAVLLEKPFFLDEKNILRARSTLQKLGVSDPAEDDVLFEAAVSFGRKDKLEIAEYFKAKIGFDISAASEHWGDVIVFSKIRNVIVHRASIVDERFLDFARAKNFPFEVTVGKDLMMPEAWIMQIANNVDKCIFTIDNEISKYVSVHKRNRYGHFWLSRSAFADELVGTSSAKTLTPPE